MGGRQRRLPSLPRPTANFFTTLFSRLDVEKAFTNNKFRVGLRVTFGLNDWRVLIHYPSWSAKGFGEAIELLVAGWVKPLDTDIWLFVLTHYASWPT